MSDETEQRGSWVSERPLAAFGILAVLIVTVWMASLCLSTFLGKDWPMRGQFGDSFGSVNALFTGLAFGGLLITIWMQRDELALQRTELKLQRREMAKSRGELEAQVKTQQGALLVSIVHAQLVVKEAAIRAKEAKITATATINQQQSAHKYADEIQAIAEKMADIGGSVAELIIGLDLPVDLKRK